MENIPQFNKNKYYLGRLCKNGHEYYLTGKSLRFRSNRVCKRCGTKRRTKDRKRLKSLGICVDCYNPVDSDRELCDKCAEKHNGRSSISLLRKYNITQDDYDSILNRQKGRCAICGDGQDIALSVDHCHSTGFVRGLLCKKCNAGLGYFKDDPKILLSAIIYLRKAAKREAVLVDSTYP